MSPDNTYKLMRFYMEVLILGITLQYMFSASLTLYQPMTHRCIMITPYPHKAIGIYMGELTLGAILQYMVSASFSSFLWSVKG